MRGKILGIALCIVGIASLIISLIYVSVIGDIKHVSLLLAGGIIGAVAFFMGLRMIPGATIIKEQQKYQKRTVAGIAEL